MSQQNTSIEQQSLSRDQGSPQKKGEGGAAAAATSKDDTFDKKLQEQDKILAAAQEGEAVHEGDSDLYDEDGNFDEFTAKVKGSFSFKLKESSLRCPALDHNPIFTKLRQRLIKFHLISEKYRKCGATEKQLEERRQTGLDFNYMIQLMKCLKRMLREVVLSDDKANQELYLKRTYEWFVKQQQAAGLLPKEQVQKEQDFLNPAQVRAKEAELAEKVEEKRLEYMDDDKHDKYLRDMFAWEERTEHKGIIPARERIKQYKTKNIRRNLPSALPPKAQAGKSRMLGVQSQADLKAAASAKGMARPTTAGLSAFGQSEALTAASANVAGQDSQAALQNARELSAFRFSKFEENEKSVKSQPYKAFFTSNEPTCYHKENRFEGKSNYQFYYPTGETFEQELEQFWFEAKNKELMDKRRDEEHKQTMKEWGQARGRMEAEIARKKEHLNVATNFAAARGWTRTCWKSKNHPIVPDSHEAFLHDESSEEEVDPGKGEVDSPDSPSRLRGMSQDSPGLKASYLRASQQRGPVAPMMIDLTAEEKEYGFRLSTEQMVTQLAAIEEHNFKLPPRKKAKESLPEISAPNIHCTTVIQRDLKKGTVHYARRYQNVGFVDSSSHEPDLKRHASAFSVASQARAMQVRSSKLRIASLRKNFGALISASDSKEAEVNNPFLGMPTGAQTTSAMSLSVYNRPASLARPKTAKVHIGPWGPTDYDPNAAAAEGEEGGAPPVPPEQPPEEEEGRLPNFKAPDDISMVARTATQQVRAESMQEIAQIQAQLARKGCPMDMVTLQRAIMIPEDLERRPFEKAYPPAVASLMVNPFPKAKKKKKGKKKKK